jgi:GNAT superfamily N-acetyltransferase
VTGTSIEVRPVAWDHPDSERLRGAQRAELTIRYGTPDSEPGIAPSADDITAFFVAYSVADTGAAEPAGCGGLRQLDASSGEIKRMFVVPAHRGTGVSVAVLRTLEREARERGWTRLLLETGFAQPDAIRFYEREGYTLIPNFGHYVDSVISRCYARNL